MAFAYPNKSLLIEVPSTAGQAMATGDERKGTFLPAATGFTSDCFT